MNEVVESLGSRAWAVFSGKIQSWGCAADNKEVMWPRNNPSIWQNHKQYTFLQIIYFLNKNMTILTDKHTVLCPAKGFSSQVNVASNTSQGKSWALGLASFIWCLCMTTKAKAFGLETLALKIAACQTRRIWFLVRCWHHAVLISFSDVPTSNPQSWYSSCCTWFSGS